MEDKLVLVTGASGFVGSHVVQQLQVAGYRVRGTVRSLTNEDKVAPLRTLVPGAKHKLELVEADLTSDGGWDEAVAGCWAVIHPASVVGAITAELSEDVYLEAGLEGTLRIMRASARAGVKKMVITGSFEAVSGDPKPWVAGKTYTEDDWTDPSYPNLEPYAKGKTMAEIAAWGFVKNMPDNKKMDLTVILPTYIWGPPLLKAQGGTQSIETMIVLLTNRYPGYPNMCTPYCDVRDVAEAHVKTLTTPEAVGKRINIITKCEWIPNMAKMLNEELKPQGYSLYTNTLPYFMWWIASFFISKITQTNLLQKIDTQIYVSNNRMVELLGIKATDLKKTALDMAYAVIDLGLVPKTSLYKGPSKEHYSTPS